jgi:hypothetical protein
MKKSPIFALFLVFERLKFVSRAFYPILYNLIL